MKVHGSFQYNAISFHDLELQQFMQLQFVNGEPWEREHARFILDWISEDADIAVSSSGSTGVPKILRVGKDAMVKSAMLTAKFFNAFADTSALLCLPSTYIAGKMMLVRAMVLGWDLRVIAPASRPLSRAFESIDFAAFTPMQLSGLSRQELSHLEDIAQVIIGGAVVSDTLRLQLAQCHNSIFESYGMAETLGHVALRKISSNEEPFAALEGVLFTTDDHSRLLIQAPHVQVDIIETQDVVELIDRKHFHYQGRYDQMINSGGVKLFPEAIERKLAALIDLPFYITSEPDALYGQRVVLFIESDTAWNDEYLKKHWAEVLDRFEIPKRVYVRAQFERTTAEKIIRKKP